MTETLPRSESTSANVPLTWEHSKLGDILTMEYGKGLPKAKRNPQGNVPVYGSSGIAGYHDQPLNGAPCLIVGRKGAAGSVHLSDKPCWTIDTAYYIEPPDGIDLGYLFYLLRTAGLNTLDKSTAVPSLSRDDAYSVGVAIAPTNEQRRIVERVEELFTKLDAGVRSLEQTQALLKSYRRSVLKAAVEGELSREWRETHKDELEPASELLERILQERREKFSGKKYKEPASPDTSELPALPEEWEWARAEQLCDFITKGTTPKANKLSKVGDVPFIKVYNLTHSGTLDFSINPTFVDNETHTGFLSRSKVYPQDVLTNIVGPPLGKVSITPDIYPEWNINQAIAVFRSLPSYETKFLSYLLLTPQILAWAKRRAKATAGQFNLTLAICRDLPLPVPSLEEQRVIVEEVERRLSVVDKLEAILKANLKQASRLRESILKRAFSGQLVPQDPDDEPASVLLERIRAEHQAAKPKARKGRKSKARSPRSNHAEQRGLF